MATSATVPGSETKKAKSSENTKNGNGLPETPQILDLRIWH